MSLFSRNSWKKKPSEAPSESTSAPASGLASSQVVQQLQVPTNSQSPQEKQQSQSVPWSAHALPFGQSPSPFLRDAHALSTSATPAGELFLFGGYVHSSESPSNDLYIVSTQDFSTTLLQTGGDVPSPRFAHGAALVSTTLLIWGGRTDFSDQNAQNQSNDDSFLYAQPWYVGPLMSRLASTDQSFLRPSIARVDLHRGQWARAQRSLLPYHDVGWFQALRLRWQIRQEVFK